MWISARILRRIDADENLDRFYELTLEPTLFGEWAVVRRWGRFQGPGQKRETWFQSPSPAQSYMNKLYRQKLRKGYQEAGVKTV